MQVDVVGPLDFSSNLEKKKSPVKLAKHELWCCFRTGAAHMLRKAGTLIHLLKSASQKEKYGEHY